MIKNVTANEESKMKIAILQSKQPFDYDVRNPKEYDREYCLKLGKEYYDREFSRMEDALSKGAKLLVTIEAFNVLVNRKGKNHNRP